ncbi:MAG TPA: hypothetical protein VJ777_04185 [Mycobacterium sp.]|nr:hypothetical protein [Mycobacterium sp.]
MNYRYTPLAVPAAPARPLDLHALKRGFFYVAVALMFFAPFSQDPVALAAGAVVPWLVLQLLARPAMPVAVVYLFIWQWMQIFARVLQSIVDGESLANGLYGPNVARAYWYMLASLVVMALAFRMVLGNLKPATPQDRTAHFEWRPMDLFSLYVGMLFLSVGCRFASMMVPALDQPLDAVSRLKVVLLFMLFTTVMTTGRNTNLMWGAVVLEIVLGFTGLLSDFRGVFIYLAIAALASRIPLKGTTVAVGLADAGLLLFLALFWTSVKAEYREFATASSDSQNVKVAIDDRFGYLGNRLLSTGSIDWNLASYALLARMAYTDIFGSVIGVQETSPEPVFVRQWQDAVEHVVKPRFLFPNKAALSDTEVYVRLARGDSSEQVRLGTSISVGYMAENFVDFGFPGMLGGMFVLGVMYALVIRYFLALKVPWILREGVVLGFVFSVAHNGVEMSLPKILGATVMFVLVYTLLARFAFPTVLNWLKGRSAVHQQPQLS